MKNVQHDALLEQALDIRAARTLCRDGWTCQQINAVLKNTDITNDQFLTIQLQSQELDKLQKVFGPPLESLSTGHIESHPSELDFLNRGPDAATAVLQEKGWQGYEISLVLKQTMFQVLDETPAAAVQHNSYTNSHPVTIPAAFPTQARNGYTPGPSDIDTVTALPSPDSRALPRRSSRRSLSRDTFMLTFMAAFALALVFTLL